MLKSKLILGDLKIKLPSVEDTGIYTCKAGEKILAYYEIDFQDAKQIHISHASLGQKEQANTTIDLGEKGTVEMFTVWTDWQPCDRCGVQGERKKVGFCYAKITPEEEPVPCGLLNATFKQVPLTHGPELRIEMCNVSCDELLPVKEDPNSAHFLLLDNYHTHLHADALLKCPTSSIYRPVYWEHANNSVTHLQQLLKIISYSLDNATGGGSLFIPVLNKSDAGIYKCYVNHKLAGKFQVTFPNINYKPERVYTLAESLVIGLSMFLISLMLLSIAQACRKTVAVGAR
ncbi:hypothetical protein FKM82_013068 [Ascaphus truei]